MTASQITAAGGFNYAQVPTEHVAGARECASWVRTTMQRLEASALETLAEVGTRLNEAKAAIGHGGFMRWVQAECGLSHSTANRAMALAEAFEPAQIRHVTNLPRALVYDVIAPSTPTEIRDEFKALVAAGETIPADDFANRIGQAKQQHRTAKARLTRRGIKATPEAIAQQQDRERRQAIRDAKERFADHEARAAQSAQDRALAEKIAGLLLAGLTDSELADLRAAWEPLGRQNGPQLIGAAILEELRPDYRQERELYERSRAIDAQRQLDEALKR